MTQNKLIELIIQKSDGLDFKMLGSELSMQVQPSVLLSSRPPREFLPGFIENIARVLLMQRLCMLHHI